MKKHIQHGGIHRIGDKPEHIMDNERFLGRDPLDDLWMTKKELPLTKVIRETNAVVLEVALAGFQKKGVKVEISNNMLSIKAYKPADAAFSHQQESVNPTFVQTYQLPGNIELQKVSARLRQGVLRVRLPYAKKQQPCQYMSARVLNANGRNIAEIYMV